MIPQYRDLSRQQSSSERGEFVVGTPGYYSTSPPMADDEELLPDVMDLLL